MNANRYGISSDLLDALCPVVGSIAINWSMAESALEQMVLIFHKDCGGDKYEKMIPMMLDRKIRFCRKCVNNLPSLTPYRDRLLRLLDRMAKLSQVRHDVIHGALSEYNERTRRIKFSRLRGDVLHHPHYTVRQLLAAQGRILGLGTALLLVNKKLAEQFLA